MEWQRGVVLLNGFAFCSQVVLFPYCFYSRVELGLVAATSLTTLCVLEKR